MDVVRRGGEKTVGYGESNVHSHEKKMDLLTVRNSTSQIQKQQNPVAYVAAASLQPMMLLDHTCICTVHIATIRIRCLFLIFSPSFLFHQPCLRIIQNFRCEIPGYVVKFHHSGTGSGSANILATTNQRLGAVVSGF